MSKAQCLSSDIITTLPQTIIDTILCLLPIEEAARTSILSRDWRYKWTKIPKLVFCKSTVPERTIEDIQTYDIESARKNMDWRCKLIYAILQVLLLHQGHILDFNLSVKAEPGCFEIDQILLHLSRNHAVKKLKLELSFEYMLPSCLFSLHHLTDLYIFGCVLDLPPIFTGFGNLRSLTLDYVEISAKALLFLLSNCPSLKTLTLILSEDDGYESCTIEELFECLPVVEQLTIFSNTPVWILVDPVPKQHLASLIHLKYFCFEDMHFMDKDLSFLVVLIKCSPNLEKIRLEVNQYARYENLSGILEKYSDVWLEHLKNVEIDCFSNLKPQMEFVKFILARSPKLKKVSLINVVKTKQERLEILKVLLRVPRTSPVEIIIV